MDKTIILFCSAITMFIIVFTIVYTVRCSYKKEHFEPVDVKAGYESGVKVPEIETDTIGAVKTFKLMDFNILDIIYPIGCVYTSFENKNPKDLYGFGEWEPLNDVFLWAGKNTSKGGSKKIEIDNLPAHNHTASCADNGKHDHKFTGDEISGGIDSIMLYDGNDAGDYSAYGVFSATERTGNRTWEAYDASGSKLKLKFSATPSGSISNNGTHSHAITIANTGSNKDYMPPYQTVYMWRRKS